MGYDLAREARSSALFEVEDRADGRSVSGPHPYIAKLKCFTGPR